MNTVDTIKQNRSFNNFDEANNISKRNTLYATILTFLTMIVEIVCGYYYNSMALLADGWHMSTHALALGLAFIAYVLSSKYANDFRFNFGTYKIEVLAGYTSAILLVLVALFMAFHSIERIISPVNIAYKEAIWIAIIGLVVNIICAWLLKDNHNHGDSHEHEHHHLEDINLKAAYIHVLTDALTSILAIIALVAGMLWGINWLDPFMGIVASILISIWAVSIIKQSGTILLDANMKDPVVQEVIDVINSLNQKVRIEDLHIFRVGKGKYGCIVSLSSEEFIDIGYIKKELSIHEELVYISVEIVNTDV